MLEDWDEQMVDSQVSADSAEFAALQKLQAQDVWAALRACCNDERDYVVARLIFVSGIKPRDVARQHSSLFSDVAEVYRVKRNLLDRLRRHPILREMRENK